jgi:hypothetical protein
MSYSENQLNALAQSNPKELARILISPNADVHTLTFGAEILGGEVKDEAMVLPVFRFLLKHVNAVVREGALIGVSAFYSDKKPPQEIMERVKIIAHNDPSPTLKEVAKDLITQFE